MSKGHLDQHYQGTHSTKPKQSPFELMCSPQEPIDTLENENFLLNLHPDKTTSEFNEVMLSVLDYHGHVFTDQTGKFPV